MSEHVKVLREIQERGQFPHWLDLVAVNEALDAAIAALTRSEVPAGWQPIETAPKDGTPVLLYRPMWSIHYVIGRWNERLRQWRTDGGRMILDAEYWTALPAPPTDSRGAE